VIPDIAVIVSVYAVARLVCEYVAVGDQWKMLRAVVAVIACGFIVVFMVSVISAVGSINL
jgi:hypothetical protein